MSKLESTDPYFIRCIKPNAEKMPNEFNSELVLKQLRNTGMLETIRIRRMGYPLRLSFEEFYQRYYMLKADLQKNNSELRDKSLLLVNHMHVSNEDYQLGNSMVPSFFLSLVIFFFLLSSYSFIARSSLDFYESGSPENLGGRETSRSGCSFHSVVLFRPGNGFTEGISPEEEGCCRYPKV